MVLWLAVCSLQYSTKEDKYEEEIKILTDKLKEVGLRHRSALKYLSVVSCEIPSQTHYVKMFWVWFGFRHAVFPQRLSSIIGCCVAFTVSKRCLVFCYLNLQIQSRLAFCKLSFIASKAKFWIVKQNKVGSSFTKALVTTSGTQRLFLATSFLSFLGCFSVGNHKSRSLWNY